MPPKVKKGEYQAQIRIPTASKYAFIELSMTGTPAEIVKAYYAVSETYWKESRKRAKAAGKNIIKSEQ